MPQESHSCFSEGVHSQERLRRDRPQRALSSSILLDERPARPKRGSRDRLRFWERGNSELGGIRAGLGAEANQKLGTFEIAVVIRRYIRTKYVGWCRGRPFAFPI
jgi:hypothetical protein